MKKLFWLAGALVLGFISYLGWIYYSFYKDVREVKDSILRYTFENGPLHLPVANNDYVSTWGAFGDFIGGTLNPFLTFISVCLILWTIRQNRKMLDNSSDALKSSIEMQDEVKKNAMIQILDNRVFSTLDSLSNLEKEIKEHSDFNDFYRKIIENDINFKEQYNQIYFNKNKNLIYFVKKIEFLFDMINKEIYSTYEKDLNGLKEYQKTILNNKLTSDYLSGEWLNSKIDVEFYFKTVRYLSDQEYEHKKSFEKTAEFNVVCSINNLINRYTLIIKSTISLEMQQFLVIYSSFKSELKKYMIAYGFLEELLLCEVSDGFEKEYKVSNNLLCSILRQNDYNSKGELSDFYYKRLYFNLHDDLHKVQIYNFIFFRSYISSNIMDISDINKKIFGEIEEIRVNDYLKGIEFNLYMESKGYKFIIKIGGVDYDQPIIYTNKGARFKLLNDFYYIDLDENNRPEVLDSKGEKIITQSIQIKNPL